VVPLCRAHLRIFDRARLALAPFICEEALAAEIAHALTHVSAARLRDALEGGGWPPPWKEQDENKETGR
jgi:hypothetical protein